MRSIIFLTILASMLASSVVVCDQWALLVAGSNTYDNYRHQADICHAYHILHKHGIPDDRIVVMMYDDIAYNQENPFKGNIINRPNGTNLYPGVLKDYVGKDVNPEVFLKVLTGDEEGLQKSIGRKGKVIKSGPNDNVFVYFADHGAPGLIAFPDDELHAEDLNNAILKMHSNRQYKYMVFYIEACESGSMFDNILRKDINVYATTAANPDESSFAIYLDKERETYLGDVYSVYWMQDSDVENLNKETLNRQFEIVKRETNTSHVMEYGDLRMGHMKVGDFQGHASSRHSNQIYEDNSNELQYNNNANIVAIPSEDVPMDILKRKAEVATGVEKARLEKEIHNLLNRNLETRKFFERVVRFASGENISCHELFWTKIRFTDFKCYRQSVKMIKSYCPGLRLNNNGFALRNLRLLANLCETETQMERVWAAIRFMAQESAICQ